ncbi:MAG: ATP-binding cassette domain-containing protein [Terrimonas sp.]|nr:ATP-binding cassette domain-containing protein [Terrimonas sp.]
MPDTVIKVENLGKRYIIGHQGKGGYRTFREQVMQGVRSVFSKTSQMISGQQVVEGDEVEEFWALKDLNFEVGQGERIGIIGRNGAGKSTLLKVLSRITEPTTGRIAIRGRVASLLEVGTGFHPELTGRENIFLNGAIMGMGRAEIKRKFDEIVDFSGVEKFLDTPVKRYSSGMYVRLAFSVAAHLEPEILVVDEVLAVGDAEFQKKCLGKMKDVSSNEGRTVLFVSHNLMALSSLCSKGIYLKNGQLRKQGMIEDVLSAYSKEGMESHLSQWQGLAGDEHIQVTAAKIYSPADPTGFFTHQDIVLEIEGELLQPVYGMIMGFTLWSQYDYQLAYSLFDDTDPSTEIVTQVPGRFKKSFRIPANTLASGSYRIQLDVGIHNQKRIINNECDLEFTVENIAGIGRKYLTDAKGFRSLFRPGWSSEKF